MVPVFVAGAFVPRRAGSAAAVGSESRAMNLPIALTLFRIVLVPPIMVFLISSDRGSACSSPRSSSWPPRSPTGSTGAWRGGGTRSPSSAPCSTRWPTSCWWRRRWSRSCTWTWSPAWMAVVIIGRELAVTGLRGVALSMGVVVPASSLGKAKTVSQYVALTLLILEKGVPAGPGALPPRRALALWIALGAHRGLGRRLLLLVLPPHQPEGPGEGPRAMALTVLGLLAAYLIGAIPVGLPGGPRRGRHRHPARGQRQYRRHQCAAHARHRPRGAHARRRHREGLRGGAWRARSIGPEAWAAAGGTVAAIAGNCWPVFLRFRGGKGVATGLGAFLALIPWAVAPAALLWIAVTAVSRYVSMASVVACLSLPVGCAGARLSAPLGRRGGGGGADHRLAPPREHRAPGQRHRAAARRAHPGRVSRPADAGDARRAPVTVLGAGSWGTALAMHLGARRRAGAAVGPRSGAGRVHARPAREPALPPGRRRCRTA